MSDPRNVVCELRDRESGPGPIRNRLQAQRLMRQVERAYRDSRSDDQEEAWRERHRELHEQYPRMYGVATDPDTTDQTLSDLLFLIHMRYQFDSASSDHERERLRDQVRRRVISSGCE